MSTAFPLPDPSPSRLSAGMTPSAAGSQVSIRLGGARPHIPHPDTTSSLSSAAGRQAAASTNCCTSFCTWMSRCCSAIYSRCCSKRNADSAPPPPTGLHVSVPSHGSVSSIPLPRDSASASGGSQSLAPPRASLTETPQAAGPAARPAAFTFPIQDLPSAYWKDLGQTPKHELMGRHLPVDVLEAIKQASVAEGVSQMGDMMGTPIATGRESFTIDYNPETAVMTVVKISPAGSETSGYRDGIKLET